MATISPISNAVPMASPPSVQSSAASSSAPVQKPVLQAVPQTTAQASDKPVTEQKVQHAVNQANQMLSASGSNETISFAYEAKLNQLYVKIVDQDSGKVVREIPSKDFIQHQIALREMIGMILDKIA